MKIAQAMAELGVTATKIGNKTATTSGSEKIFVIFAQRYAQTVTQSR
jgi:hypothetical protein